jgi:hypothetical protein
MNDQSRNRRAYRAIRRLERALNRHALHPGRGTSQSVQALKANFEKIKARAREDGLDEFECAWHLALNA